ncbi:phospholipase A1 member A-like [Diorhabda sublineata]|uniref:phospholipase A1 member A-like n=1 Tax=Diorhabda sublineata TaxID=1163346 RepID=UPI0024E12B55|nr:phospholipase A1 member A-like [Diorhabda sublineata]
MNTIATIAGLALASAATAAMIIMAIADGKTISNSTKISYLQFGDNSNQESLIDPHGPVVQFILFTKNNSAVNLKIGDDDKLKHSGLNVTNPTKIIIHGFTSSVKDVVFTLLKTAYLDSGDYNVIGMDWSQLCNFEYITAMSGVREAGQFLANFIKWLRSKGVSLEDIHLVGHSMGAHVAGVGGARLKNGKVGRITGLDPAKPGYRDNRLDNKLDPSDALLVEGLHTFVYVLGLAETVGHVDFYPNGGLLQPGCPELNNFWTIGESLLCNHGRAYYLFAEAIKNHRAFKSTKCSTIQDAIFSKCVEKSDIYMGQPETYSGRGIYYFKTRSNFPYTL